MTRSRKTLRVIFNGSIYTVIVIVIFIFIFVLVLILILIYGYIVSFMFRI